MSKVTFIYMRITKAFILIFLFSIQFVSAQEIELPFTGELDIKFDKNEQEKLIKCVISLQEAKVKLAESKAMYDNLDADARKEKGDRISKELREVYKLFEDANNSFDFGYFGIYEIYKKNCNKFWETQRELNHYVTGMEKAKFYERMATRAMGRGQTARSDAAVSKKFLNAYSITLEANTYLYQGIRSQGRALQIYRDYPVEYNYNWENDIDIDKILTERRGRVVEEAQVDTSVQTFRNDTNLQESKIVYIHDTIFIIVKDSLDYEDTTVTFRVQIAAHTEPLSQEYLRTIYFGSRDIFELQEEGWYKYSIGIFKDYYKARQIAEESGVRRAFIVPYVAGIKISIREALDRMGLSP